MVKDKIWGRFFMFYLSNSLLVVTIKNLVLLTTIHICSNFHFYNSKYLKALH